MDKNKIHLAILWHQHQPLYLEPAGKGKRFRFPWVRLHAIRDYYPMAALVAQYPKVHLTINLVPSLILQIEGYTEGRFMDRALELTLKPAKNLTAGEKEEILQTFFDADWHHQIYPHPRYKELFEQRVARQSFSNQDITDLQMWFNLGWFAPEFLEGETKLHDGICFNLEPFIKKERGFSQADIQTMIDAQYAVMRNIVPLHRHLQERGQIEISTTPFYHPILPLIHDTDLAKAGSPAMKLPSRFQAPEDAQTQVDMAVDFYKSRFGRSPRGMWPAEGAVGQSVIDYFARSGIRWIASDEGVLERSGKWGYRTQDPNVLCQPYRAEGSKGALSIFFRDKNLSDAIGFKYQHFQDQAEAANAFITELKNRLANHVTDSANRVVTVVLDGENAWSAYQKAARPFLHTLYRALSDDSEIKTVTFSEYLEGDPSRTIMPHPIDAHPKVYDLFHGSWIDAWGSEPGTDLATWIGEEEENRGWELVKMTREDLSSAQVSTEERTQALKRLYAAEGSDWFWWFGADQESGYDEVFDDLFRGHLCSVYDAMKIKPPLILNEHIVSHVIVWTFTNPVSRIQSHDRLTIRTNCAGTLRWSIDNGLNFHEITLSQAGGVMAGLHSYSGALGPFPEGTKVLLFAFRCSECGCQGKGECCGAQLQKVLVESADRLEPQTFKKIKSGVAP
jgi:alpha-amylase/alpha-mannosidase (GH57 family)